MATDNGQENDEQQPKMTGQKATDTDGRNKSQAESSRTGRNSKITSQTKKTNGDATRNTTQANGGIKLSATQLKEKALELHDKIQRRRVMVVWLIIAAVLAVVIIVAGCYAFWDHKNGEKRDYQQLQSLTQKPARMTEQGGLPAFPASQYNPKAPSVDLYVDFFCPGCSTVERGLSKPLQLMRKARQINLYIHPVNFLDHKTQNHYSTRAASAFAYVASKEPDKLLAFSTALFDKEYQPNKNNNRNVSDQEIVGRALKAGVSEKVARDAVKGTYTDYVNTATKYTLRRKELYVHMQDNYRFSTPTLCINGTMWHYRQLHTLQDIPPTFIHSLGLHRNQVGDSSVIPSIGPHGKALAIQQKYL